MNISHLRAHQRAALKHIIQRKGVGILIHDPGLGKTATALTFLEALARKKNPLTVNVLVVAPLSAAPEWPKEAAKWLPDDVAFEAGVLGGTIKERAATIKSGVFGKTLEYSQRHLPNHNIKASLHIDVINIDTLSGRKEADNLVRSVKHRNYDVLIADELHNFRRYSNRQRLLKRMAKYIPRRIGMTGTFQPKGLEDAYRQLEIIDPTVFYGNYATFMSTYCQMGGFENREVISYRNVDDYEKRLGEVAHVATKEEALDLPPTTDTIIEYTLSPAEMKAYKEMKVDLMTEFSNGDILTVGIPLTKTLRLRQIACGYAPNEDGDIQNLGFTKAKYIKDLVDNQLLGEKRIVIFTNFRDEQNAIVSALEGSDVEVLRIDGHVKAAQRDWIAKKFASDYKYRVVLVANIATVSTGINWMTSASHAIFSSLPLAREEYIQARGRLDRSGQTRPVTYWVMQGKGTLEGLHYSSFQNREALDKVIFDHIMSK